MNYFQTPALNAIKFFLKKEKKIKSFILNGYK